MLTECMTKCEAGERGTSWFPFDATFFLETLTLILDARRSAVLSVYLGSLPLFVSHPDCLGKRLLAS